jgi:hypothetical protein
MYGDGANLYQYLGSNPWQRHDPLGTSWDPFEMVDEVLAERAGAASSLLSALGQSARSAAVIAATIASYLPFPVAGLAGEMALVALGEESMDDMATGVAIGLIPGGKLLGGLGKAMSGLGRLVGKIGSSAWSAAKHYAGKFVSFLADKVGGLFGRAFAFLRKACTCFDAGTPVWTMRGQVPIEQVHVGDLVVAQNEATGEISLRPVVRTFTRDGGPIVSVTLKTPVGTQVLDTTEEHPFFVEGRGWTATQALQPGETVRSLSGPATVEAVSHGLRHTTVFNFEVEGLHDYHVGATGVLVHNAPGCKKVRHHVFPKFRERPDLQKYFSDRNIDVDALTKELDEGTHIGIHPGWNNEWIEFMTGHPNASRTEVFQQAASMLEAYGIADAPTLPYWRTPR